jgi:cation transport regulator ChaC
MDEDSFRGTVGEGNYEILGKAVLKDYRLAYTFASHRRKGGAADVLPAPGETVEGVLYRLKPEAWSALDEREGVARGWYERKKVRVEVQGAEVETDTYMVVRKEPRELAPSYEYTRLIHNGAVRFLSPHYRRKLVRRWSEEFGLPEWQEWEEIEG